MFLHATCTNREATNPFGETQKELQYIQPLTRSALGTLLDVLLRYRLICKPITSWPAVTLWQTSGKWHKTKEAPILPNYTYIVKTITYLSFKPKHGSHSKVTDLQIILIIQKEILRLQIAMCNPAAMQVLLVINTPHERLILVAMIWYVAQNSSYTVWRGSTHSCYQHLKG
jgi:hypothetical protein